MLPRVLDRADLPEAELCAARLDGELFPLGAGWCPLDVPPAVGERAAAALAGRPSAWIAELETAAWIWGAIPGPPSMLQACVPYPDRRTGSRRDPSVELREVVILPREVVMRGGRRITDPLRTALDLARRSEWYPSAREPVVALLALADATPESLRSALPRSRRLPHARRARRRLSELMELSRC